MATLNTTQPANQKPTGNLYMSSSGQTSATAPGTKTSSPTSGKNTWDATIAPTSMPGYGGLGRQIANPDYIPGSVKPDPNNPGALDQSLQKLADTNPEMADQSMDKLGYTNSPNSIQGANSMTPDANGNYTIDLAKIPQGPNKTISPYKQGFQQTQASGVPVAKTMGEASSTIQSTVPNTNEAPSPLTAIVDTDSTFDSIFTQFDDYFSPIKQKQSLLQEYQSMEQTLGINAMNAELLNSKRIIEGTEDDIRSEVQAVSGFATDSQVLALSNARNKSLVKNYNYLLEARDSAMTQLNTMMNLSMKDREIATQEFDTKMNFAFKVKEFQQKAIDNAKEGYNNVINTVGYKGLYDSLVASGDKTAISTVEKTLGMAQGQLSKLSKQRDLDREYKIAQINSANRANQNSGGGDKKLSVSEAEALGVPFGTTESQASQLGIIPGTGGSGVPEKIVTKIQSSPENKTINGVLPAIQAIKEYKASVDKYGTFEKLSGKGRGEKDTSYGNAIASWKTLAGLGALSGADFELAENVIPAGGKLFTRNSRQLTQLDGALSNAVVQAENLTSRLVKTYPQAETLLRSQLDDIYLTAYPNKYTRGPDGQVYEVQ